MTRIGNSDLDVTPLALGGNVFGWTADRDTSFAILDAFVDGGGNLIDTADSYSAFAEGNVGGESETIIGQWLASRAPADVLVATKVSQHPDFLGLSARNIKAAADASLQRLGTETIDLYYAHFDDRSVPLAETVGAFGELVSAGKVRQIGVSNYTAERISEWLSLADELAVPRPVAIQPHYNLVHRNEVEETIIGLAERENLGLFPYYSLASGFLTGKYRSTDLQDQTSPRAQMAAKFAVPQGLEIIRTLETIAADHGVAIASVALAWLRAQPTVVAPIASASKVEQVAGLLDSVKLDLSAEEVAALTAVSTWQG
ncbi:aldo/keto reductase [Naumannella halotolerans]|uniref:Aryl-alcohol dehydrogenase (NADP+) n=1 Tax=Naumannella halotolerans TaxID=993414 RepID=A0A4R7J3K1_9ACTN|nr:aldo/keto reductase [Naumannella halotolerans]TDT30933.1 aryl-alcohol dehydrogenase (NADP+) [Naumannella halotolerans]